MKRKLSLSLSLLFFSLYFLVFMSKSVAQNQVLTNINGGASWEDPLIHNAGNGLVLNNGVLDVGVENGLSVDPNNVRLGGNLNRQTTINHNNFDIFFNLNSTGDFEIQNSGLNIFSVIAGDGIIINNNSTSDADFRVESDNLTHLFFADVGTERIGINDNSPDALLDVGGSFRLDGTFADASGDVGTSGDILTSTTTGTDWVPSYVGAQVEPSTNQSMNTWTFVPLTFNNEIFDVGNNYNNTTNRFIVPSNGFYRVDYNICVTTSNNASGHIELRIMAGGSGTTLQGQDKMLIASTGLSHYVLSGSTVIESNSGDQILLEMRRTLAQGTGEIVSSNHLSHITFTKL